MSSADSEVQGGGIMMKVEDAVLLGVFAAIAVFGYFVMVRLDSFLDKAHDAGHARGKSRRLNIATSCPNAVPAIRNAAKDTLERFPDIQCSISLGQEREVLRAVGAGDADVAIVSAEAESRGLSESEPLALAAQSFFMDDGAVEIKAVEEGPRCQKALWRAGGEHALALQFIRQLYRQQP